LAVFSFILPKQISSLCLPSPSQNFLPHQIKTQLDPQTRNNYNVKNSEKSFLNKIVTMKKSKNG